MVQNLQRRIMCCVAVALLDICVSKPQRLSVSLPSPRCDRHSIPQSGGGESNIDATRYLRLIRVGNNI
jgi:hypothetical protein